MTRALPDVSVVIPTLDRGEVACETVGALLALSPAPREVVLVDQTRRHPPAVAARLERLEADGRVRRLRQRRASIPAALNRGLAEARSDVVLVLDDDLRPGPDLVRAHAARHAPRGFDLVAGRVWQPWDAGRREPAADAVLRDGREFMGGNFSLDRRRALALGGFDENFVHVAYRFEAELSGRWRAHGGRIVFAPEAEVWHAKAAEGGTRVYGDHLRTLLPSHAVGAYYQLLASRPPGFWRAFARRPLRAIRTRHHLRRPWWIPATLVSEALGAAWAAGLFLRGPRLASGRGRVPLPRAARAPEVR
jgi:GT2 family glycosyltransferase